MSAIRGFALDEDTEWNLKLQKDELGIGGTLDLNGHRLVIKDSVNLRSGAIDFDRGILEIQGDFSIGKSLDWSDGFDVSTGYLIMDEATDVMVVNGDFTVWTSSVSTLSNGTMYIFGDFAQHGMYPASALYHANGYGFDATDSHMVVLCGTEPQDVFFEGKYSGFATLKCMQPDSQYTFNPAQCWNKLIDYQTIMVSNFVNRMYTVALGREAEPGGVDYWAAQLLAYEIDGAGIANGFILSPEFTGRGYSDAEFIQTLYQTFFDRSADTEGLNYWTKALNGGHSREYVLSGFVNSNEFNSLCSAFGISRGMLKEDGTAINQGIWRFAGRLYTKVLERDGEKDGMEYWALRIADGINTPEDAAKGFFQSEEYVSKNTTDEKYIQALYATFMDREPDQGGMEYWLNKLAGGTSREEALSGFAQSDEFKGIMEEYGLLDIGLRRSDL